MTVLTTTVELKADRRFGVVDLTGELERAVVGAGGAGGIAVAFCRHTTCVLVVNELENGAQEDLARHLEWLVPSHQYFAHDDMTRRTENIVSDNEPANGQAHVLASLLGGTSQVVPFAAGALQLGRWQRLMLIELDDPRPRTVTFALVT